MIDGQNWPHLQELTTLTSVSDTLNPTQLALDESLQKIDNETVYYDVRENPSDNPLLQRIVWCEPEEFLALVLARADQSSDSNVVTTTLPTKLYVFNDIGPTYFTSFDDETLIFDSFNLAVDTTLQGSKSTVVAYREASFSLENTHIPDLPSKAFPQFMAEVKARASSTINQEIDRKQESIASRLQHRSEVEKKRTNNGIKFENYGRRPRGSTRGKWKERT